MAFWVGMGAPWVADFNYMKVYTCHGTCMEIREQLAGADFFNHVFQE